jgi:hypothetical protein
MADFVNGPLYAQDVDAKFEEIADKLYGGLQPAAMNTLLTPQQEAEPNSLIHIGFTFYHPGVTQLNPTGALILGTHFQNQEESCLVGWQMNWSPLGDDDASDSKIRLDVFHAETGRWQYEDSRSYLIKYTHTMGESTSGNLPGAFDLRGLLVDGGVSRRGGKTVGANRWVGIVLSGAASTALFWVQLTFKRLHARPGLV